jgi:WD40 repeat protein
MKWCSDSLEFMQANQHLIQELPLQVYYSALVFSPRESLVHQCYQPLLGKFLPAVFRGPTTRTRKALVLRGHNDHVEFAAYSSSGDLLVSITKNHETIVWDTRTGGRISQFEVNFGTKLNLYATGGRRDYCGLSFLAGDEVIASIWNDTLYRLSRKTGHLIHPGEELNPQGATFRYFAWSPDHRRFAGGTDDGHIYCFWPETKIRKGTPLKAHDESINSLSFSPDGQFLASGSWDGTIRLCEMTSDLPNGLTTLWNHGTPPHHGHLCSMKSSLFAFLDRDSLYIYNHATNVIDFALKLGDRSVTAGGSPIIVGSPNGERIAVLTHFCKRTPEIAEDPSQIHLFHLLGQNGRDVAVVQTSKTGHTGTTQCNPGSITTRLSIILRTLF